MARTICCTPNRSLTSCRDSTPMASRTSNRSRSTRGAESASSLSAPPRPNPLTNHRTLSGMGESETASRCAAALGCRPSLAFDHVDDCPKRAEVLRHQFLVTDLDSELFLHKGHQREQPEGVEHVV